MEKKDIRLFALSTCVHCKGIKRMLQHHGIEFEWTDIDLLPIKEQQEFLEQIAPYNPKKSFPVVIIGNTAIIGDQRERIMQELGITDGP